MKPNNFPLNGYRQLFFDIFIKNNNLYIICPIYNSRVNINNIKIIFNNSELKVKKRYTKISMEPADVIIYRINPNRVNHITVKYKEFEKSYELPHIIVKKNTKLAFTTLFKNDFRLMNIFYAYYKKQGVTNFYMYYNGELTDEIRQCYDLPGVTLIEWNFRYWNKDKFKVRHHAQLAQMHHALYRFGKDMNKYMIFADLDEYLYIKGKTILDFINQNPSYNLIGFRNRWSNTINNKIPDSFPDKFRTGNPIKYGKRSKNIYRVRDTITLGVHRPHRFHSQKKDITKYTFFHFYNWCKTNRVEKTNKLIILP